MNNWFYGGETSRQGPVSIDQLKQLALSRRLPPNTLVWSEGMPNWVPLGSIVHMPQVPDDRQDGALNLLLPLGPQSAWAIAAGYCGLFVLPAPLAIIFGVLGLRDLKLHPEKRGKGRAITGIVLGSLWMAIFALVLVASKK